MATRSEDNIHASRNNQAEAGAEAITTGSNSMHRHDSYSAAEVLGQTHATEDEDGKHQDGLHFSRRQSLMSTSLQRYQRLAARNTKLVRASTGVTHLYSASLLPGRVSFPTVVRSAMNQGWTSVLVHVVSQTSTLQDLVACLGKCFNGV